MGDKRDPGEDKEPAEGSSRGRRNTFRGFGASVKVADLEPEKGAFEDEPPPKKSASRGASRQKRDAAIAAQRVAQPVQVRRGQPAVDIDLIHERRTAPLPDHEWTFVEIWTRNTIYALDSHLVCIAVIDQSSRRTHTKHALLGARLVGGQLRDGESMELSHPFPRPGSEAVFEQSKGRQVRFSQTSSVTRVVLRLRVLTVASDALLPTWEEITGRHEVPGSVRGKKPRSKDR
ncbi:MAG TPA: hypothetical protein ENK57_03815 [Polyangiaceae bacterium]|nr:hypothetical protein [Polyangiaceae bacterium]